MARGGAKAMTHRGAMEGAKKNRGRCKSPAELFLIVAESFLFLEEEEFLSLELPLVFAELPLVFAEPFEVLLLDITEGTGPLLSLQLIQL